MFFNLKRWYSIKKEKNARELILIIIVVFNLLLWFVSSILAYLIQPTMYGNIIGALWSSGITWMLEPGFYDPNVVPAIRAISIVVILTSMITFSGGIIGYVSNLFSSLIENAKQGKGQLYLKNHIILLNWNHKALELIADYIYDDKSTYVVVLSSIEKEKIEQEIHHKFFDISASKTKLNVIVRQGDVFSKSDLTEIRIKEAKSIILLADEQDDVCHEDVCVLKTLMLISKMDLNPNQTILVEVKNEKTIHLIRDQIAKQSTLANQILPIFPDELMGRLIAQTLLMPGLNKVYHELFSFEGAEFYTIPYEDPITFLKQHDHAIPIYGNKEDLYVLASCYPNIYKKRETPLGEYKKFMVEDKTLYQEKTILVFGENRKLPYILESLRLFELENKVKIHMERIESNEAEVIESYTKKLSKIDHILILSKDNVALHERDSDVLITLLMTQEIAKKHHADFVVELLDPKHNDVAQSYNVKNTIISNEYISRIMTQLSKNRKLYDLFIDLLTYDDGSEEKDSYEVYKYDAPLLIQTAYPIVFSSRADYIYSMMMNSQGKFIPIGIIKEGQLEIFQGDLDEQKSLVINEKDSLIIICK